MERLIPIRSLELCDRYSMNAANAQIYDSELKTFVTPQLDESDDKLYVYLYPLGKDYPVKMELTNLYLITVYGETSCEPNIYIRNVPVNTSGIYPMYSVYRRNINNRKYIWVNDVQYVQWLDSPYYANEKGAIFSVRTMSFLRQHVNEKGYMKASLYKRSTSVHRVVWEAYHGQIPSKLEIDHDDGHRWRNDLENLNIMTHDDNIKKLHKTNSVLTVEKICDIANDIISGKDVADIASSNGVTLTTVHGIKYGRLYHDLLKENGIELPIYTISKNAANLTPELIEKIRELYNSGRSQQSLSDEFNLNRATVHSILNNLI